MSHEPTLRTVFVSDIFPTPDNPRSTIDQTAPAFLELVESIRANGILQPPLGRPHPTDPNIIDLRAGERRYRAAVAAGLSAIPILVRDMDDKTAMEITVLENLQRQDLSPLEEARGIRSLIESGHPIEHIAAELGKTAAWMTRRSKLLDLTADWRKFAEETHIPAAHLELIARYSPDVQARLFERTAENQRNS